MFEKIRDFVYLLILWLNQLVSLSFPLKTFNALKEKKLAIIGNGYALGFGDSIGLSYLPPGLARFLFFYIQDSSRIKIPWVLYNLGNFHSTSHDWLPKSINKRSLLDNPLIFNSDIILIFMGSNDKNSTLKNISIIFKTLSDMGKHVFIFDLPTVSLPHLTDLNQDLIEFCKQQDCALNSLDVSNFEYKYPGYYTGVWFNARGYKKIAKDCFDVIEKTMIKIQFEEFKKMFSS